ADSSLTHAKMLGDFLGGFFSSLANGHHRSYLIISAVRSIARHCLMVLVFCAPRFPLSVCIFEKAVGVMLVHVHLATLLAT
ncbi:hypothetical protein, partial [Stenotrophomonas maltophilia]|uniref:hypothetical protein n=1 Tax=Stenotrophomonas maltophilia TaxID=40324 RepID=UPI001EF82312